MIELNKKNQLVALSKSDQEIIGKFLKMGGSKITYYFNELNGDYHTLKIVDRKQNIVGSLAGEDALFIAKKLNISSGEYMKLSEFIKKCCPDLKEKY